MTAPIESPTKNEVIVRVVLNEPVPLLDYRVPSHLQEQVRKGIAILVPLRRRRTGAYVTEVRYGNAPAGITLKDIEGIDPERPALPESLIDLILFAAKYYIVSAGEMLACALPSMARLAAPTYRITKKGREAINQVKSDSILKSILDIAASVRNGFTVVALERRLGLSRRLAARELKHATKEGLLYIRSRRTRRLALTQEVTPTILLSTENIKDVIPAKAGIQNLTNAQAEATAKITQAIDKGKFQAILLEGVTSSGKTEVYMQAIAHALAAGKTALVLVPEIALTPQLGQAFINRFGDRVAIVHSGLTVSQRRDQWERIANNEACIGLGARSAIFLPFINIGVLVVDEEHEATFKQEETPRYNARDLAVVRAKHENAVVILGSATPSLESRANANHSRYQHLLLSERVHRRPMPEIERINLQTAPKIGEGLLTERMARALERVLTSGEQAILYLNRRGFAPYVYCRDCGYAYRCVDCDVALTLHRAKDLLICHHCGYQEMTPDECKKCNGNRLVSSGAGLEKLDIELKEFFGSIKLARLDRDSIRTRKQLLEQLQLFRSGEAKILLGTQMVTKGHDFPGVTLVGVIQADNSLNFPDFRAAERTFQLLTQVAGRAGRGDKTGIVIVQGYDINHYAIETATRYDYMGFVERELAHRREMNYPPFSHLALLRLEGTNESQTQIAASTACEELQARMRGCVEANEVSILGPAPAPITRLRGRWRWQILIKAASRVALRKVIAPVKISDSVRQILDVDPYSML
ncbi:MAG: primosomal protein N' [Deltaproteobacteria bacterium]|nr:primosomal protein N' [Deltaproteobacteria bacterium]